VLSLLAEGSIWVIFLMCLLLESTVFLGDGLLVFDSLSERAGDVSRF